MRLLVYFAIMLLAISAIAQATDVKKVGYAKIEINETINVNFAEATDGVEYVNVTLLFPSDTQTQKRIFFESTSPYAIKDTENGQVIEYSIIKPKRQNTIQTRAIVEVDYRNLIVGGQNSSISQDDIDSYTSQGNLVIIDQQIRDVAHGLKQENIIDTVQSIVSWTNQHMTYDKDYSNRNITTPEIIRLRRGTCDEFAHLSLAFSRALGIPARFPIGYVYSGEEWGMHAWVEFFVPGYGWIEADPTYNELGRIDASHVRLGYGKDQSTITQKISTYGYRQPSAVLEQNYSIGFLETANFTNDVEMSASTDEISPSMQNITITVQSHTPSEIFLPVDIYPAKELALGNPASNLLRIAPYGKNNMTFSLTVPEGKKDIVYTYPVEISTPYADKTVTFTRLDRTSKVQDDNANAGGNANAFGNTMCASIGLVALFPLLFLTGFFRSGMNR